MPFLPPPPPTPFDTAIAAFRARKNFSVAIALDALINKNVTKGRFQLSFASPRKVLLKKLVGGQTALIFWLNGNKFSAYDPASNEMTTRLATAAGPIVNQLANALGGALEDPVGAQLSPDMMAAFFFPFRNLQGWTTTKRGDTISLSRSGVKTVTQFEFSASSKLLTKALLSGPGSKLQWVFSYGAAPANLSFSPPKGVKSVKALSEHTAVNSQDPKARAIVDGSLRAYSRIDNVAFNVSGTFGASSEWVNGDSFREKQSKVEWAYSAGTLTIRDIAKGKIYRGPCSPTGIFNYLKILRAPMEPMLQAFILHKNPIKGWFLPAMKVGSGGDVALGGGRADVIQLRSPSMDISLLVRRDNHLVASVVSRAKNSAGRVVSEAQRQFSYLSVNQQIAASTFVLPAKNALPLTKIGK